ncbi:hypothetical protein KNN17_01645 [Arthrobacter bambusae]|uniref:hypothetical protein n=1 Tax=Arthrobacter TaxID=1663 RepID=UPI001F50AEFC|nr:MULTISPECIES: hypothetical protein [Arthrobacter]MCI0140276.1 hypothetical protein [Arthrobacter bambusae]UYY81656.1 hypothetical protein OIT41_00840 [Arthrobacter sp. YA7-1]
MNIEMKSVRKLRVHWPVTSETFSRLAAGEAEAFRDDQGIAALLRALTESGDLGDFGKYRHVFESGLGFEGFTVTEHANPTLGKVGQQTISPTFVFTTYFDAALDDAAVDRFTRRIMEIHPWEVPVIELSGPISVSSTALAAAFGTAAAS